jgi:hypothetical protein
MVASVCMLALTALCAQAGYLYDERVDGELPHPNAAFIIPFGTPNPNAILFTVDEGSDGWILQVDPGETLRAFTLVSFEPDSPGYSATFHMHDGTTVGDPVLGTPYASFNGAFVCLDFMDHFGIPPLGPGQYLFNFWHDNSDYPTVQFNIDMIGMSPVERSTWASIKTLYR